MGLIHEEIEFLRTELTPLQIGETIVYDALERDWEIIPSLIIKRGHRAGISRSTMKTAIKNIRRRYATKNCNG